MAIPYFVADSARVTILRPLASSAFGSYNLTLPEGIDLEDVHDFEAPGNELGHVATLTRNRRVGGLARRFVRADVAVTAADPSDPDVFPESNVDAVLEDASTRVSSDFFLESDITKAGLGPWVPFVDFKVGDKARVNIWGVIVTLQITRIEPIISDHDVVDWLVHLGGQLVSDDDAREVENETLRKAFLQDRRELAGLEAATTKAVEAVDKKASEAKGTAEEAKGTAEDALAAVGDADGAIAQKVADAEAAKEAAEEAFQEVEDLITAPEGDFRLGVSAAFWAQHQVNDEQSEFNTAVSETLDARDGAQDARDAAQDIAIQDSTDRITFQEEALAQLAGMQERLARASTRMLEAHRSEVIATDECWKLTITIDGTVARFEPVVSAPAWSGKCVAEIRVWKPSSGTSVTDESRIVRMRWNGSPGSETQIYMVEDGYLIESVMLLYNYSEGEFKTAGSSGGPVTIDESSLYTFGTFTAPVTGRYTVSASTLWANVRGGSIHECAITRIRVPLIVDSQKFHQNRVKVRIAPVPRTLSLAAGEEITFMAWTNAPFTTYRSIQWEWSVTWMEPVTG